MKIAVVTPTRGDRPQFIEQLDKMLDAQSLQPDIRIVVDDVHDCDYADVTWRYRHGFARAFKEGADIVLPMEDDDWYSDDYVQKMCLAWLHVGRPIMFGVDSTIYYHLATRKYAHLKHYGRASMMSMLIHKDLQIQWCDDSYPYLDFHMWTKMPCISKMAVHLTERLSIGIKHGIGQVAGGGHRTNMKIYTNANGQDDPKMEFLAEHVSAEQLEFYKNVIK